MGSGRDTVVTDRSLSGSGWALAVAIAVVGSAAIAMAWRIATFVDGSGITKRRLSGRRHVRWSEVTSAETLPFQRRSAIWLTTPSGPEIVHLPGFGTARRIATVQRGLDRAGHGVRVGVPAGDESAPFPGRRLVHDVDVALGRKPRSAQRPRLRRGEARGIVVLTVGLTIVTIPPAVWAAQRKADRLDEERRAEMPAIDVDALSALGEPDVRTIDIGARAIAERAFGTLRGASSSIDCDGRIPTDGGLAGVRYVSVRTADGLWESTPAVAPPTDSTTWRLGDLVDSGVFATSGPLPEPSARWEIKVNTYLGPAWFGCKPVNRPAP